MPEAALPERLRRLPGTRLTPGDIRIPASESAQLDGVLGSSAQLGELHPVYAYIATQRGIGISVAELCELADFDVADGPMLGSVDLRFAGALRPDTDYRVEGTIVDIIRKQGRAAGVFDLLLFEETLADADGAVVASSLVSFVLPRREATA